MTSNVTKALDAALGSRHSASEPQSCDSDSVAVSSQVGSDIPMENGQSSALPNNAGLPNEPNGEDQETSDDVCFFHSRFLRSGDVKGGLMIM